MTPTQCFLDPAYDRDADPPIYPGMVMSRTAGENVILSDSGMEPYGFAALFVGGDSIDEPLEVGINAFAVWVMSPDASAEVLAPAFDTGATWTDPGDGTDLLIHFHDGTGAAEDRGKLVPAGHAAANDNPVARLFKVNSATKITIQGLAPRTP